MLKNNRYCFTSIPMRALAFITSIRGGSFSKYSFLSLLHAIHVALDPFATNAFCCCMFKFLSYLGPWCLFWLTFHYPSYQYYLPPNITLCNWCWLTNAGIGQAGWSCYYIILCGEGTDVLPILRSHHQIVLIVLFLIKVLLVWYLVFIINSDF